MIKQATVVCASLISLLLCGTLCAYPTPKTDTTVVVKVNKEASCTIVFKYGLFNQLGACGKVYRIKPASPPTIDVQKICNASKVTPKDNQYYLLCLSQRGHFQPLNDSQKITNNTQNTCNVIQTKLGGNKYSYTCNTN